MRLKTIEIHNFRVFDHFTFEFPQAPGLYLLAGRNEDAPQLGGNGVGKSSLFDAITFALFGQSARGLSGGDLVRDGMGHTDVLITTDSDTYRRVWSKSSKTVLQMNGTNVGSAEVLARIGLTHEMFVTSTIIPQKVPMFAEQKPVTQVALLQDLLALERWVEFATRAAAKSTDLTKSVAAKSSMVASLKSRIEAIDIAAIERRSDLWKEQQIQRIEAAVRRVRELELSREPAEGVQDMHTALAEARSKFARASNNQRVLNKQIDALRNEKHTLSDQTTAVSIEMRVLENSMRTLKEDNKLLESGAGTCPACHQAITPKHRTACLKTAATKLAGKQDVWDARSLTYNRMLGEIAELDKGITAKQTQLRDAERSATVNQAIISQYDKRLAVETERVRMLDTKIQEACAYEDDLRDEVNPHAEAWETAQAALVKAQADLIEAEKALTVVQDEAARFALWSKSFKSIRSQLVSDALHQFATEIAIALEDMGLLGWECMPMFDASVFESARNATGFRFVVETDKGIERPLDAFSGGELVRVQLSIQSALGALIADTHGAPMDFEFWDEPSTYLSKEGVEGLFVSLRNRAQRLARPIFIVDHHYAHSSELDGVYRLVKRDGATTLEA